MTICFADTLAVDTAGQRVDVDDDVHVVFCDGIGRNILEILLLVARVQLTTRKLRPGGIGGRDTQDVDVDGSQFVNIGTSNPSGISLFQDGAASRA